MMQSKKKINRLTIYKRYNDNTPFQVHTKMLYLSNAPFQGQKIFDMPTLLWKIEKQFIKIYNLIVRTKIGALLYSPFG